jgi:hypothetical protein
MMMMMMMMMMIFNEQKQCLGQFYAKQTCVIQCINCKEGQTVVVSGVVGRGGHPTFT